MEQEVFERLVDEALEALDPELQEQLDNVVIVVENWPDPHTMRQAGVRSPYHLLGFYHGVPQTQRNHYYGMVTPDKISIYRGPIMRRCRNDAEVAALIRRVLHHEIAHHFGIDDDRLQEIDAY